MEILVIFSIFLICISCFVIILSIMNYIFMGFGLMGLGKTAGEKTPWLSWIPYANQYMLGKIAMNNTAGIILVIFTALASLFSTIVGFSSGMIEYMDSDILYFALMIVGIIVAMIGITFSIFYYIVCYKLYNKFSQKAVIMTVFTVLTMGIIAPIFIFAIRNNPLREETL